MTASIFITNHATPGAMSQGRMKAMEELKRLLNVHEGRSGLALRTAVATSESLLSTFDDYVTYEIQELHQQIALLESVRRPVEKEKARLKKLDEKFKETHLRLSKMLKLVKDGKIKNLSISEIFKPSRNFLSTSEEENDISDTELDSIEIGVIIEGFKIIGELEDIREDIRRWVDAYIGDMDDLLSIIRETVDPSKAENSRILRTI